MKRAAARRIYTYTYIYIDVYRHMYINVARWMHAFICVGEDGYV